MQDSKRIMLRGYVTGSAREDGLVVWAGKLPISHILLQLPGKRNYRWGRDHCIERVEVKIEIKTVPPTKRARRKP